MALILDILAIISAVILIMFAGCMFVIAASMVIDLMNEIAEIIATGKWKGRK